MKDEERKPIKEYFKRAFTEGNLTPSLGCVLDDDSILVITCNIRKIEKKNGKE
jgi:hypothetical protein